jgi:hypothetical protein
VAKTTLNLDELVLHLLGGESDWKSRGVGSVTHYANNKDIRHEFD